MVWKQLQVAFPLNPSCIIGVFFHPPHVFSVLFSSSNPFTYPWGYKRIRIHANICSRILFNKRHTRKHTRGAYHWPLAQWGGRWAGCGWCWCPPARAGRPVATARESGRAASLGTRPDPPPSAESGPAQRRAEAQMHFHMLQKIVLPPAATRCYQLGTFGTRLVSSYPATLKP